MIKNTKDNQKNVPYLVGQIAMKELQLNCNDVLLDLGTGTGDKAISSAHICKFVIGIDINKKSLKKACKKAEQEKIANLIFAYGSFEDPCATLNLYSYKINKILMVYSLHHISDQKKKESLIYLSKLLVHPGRIVIGDIIFFDDPDRHREKFDEVAYDGGDTDFPASAGYLVTCLKEIGASVRTIELHPLAGVLAVDFG